MGARQPASAVQPETAAQAEVECRRECQQRLQNPTLISPTALQPPTPEARSPSVPLAPPNPPLYTSSVAGLPCLTLCPAATQKLRKFDTEEGSPLAFDSPALPGASALAVGADGGVYVAFAGGPHLLPLRVRAVRVRGICRSAHLCPRVAPATPPPGDAPAEMRRQPDAMHGLAPCISLTFATPPVPSQPNPTDPPALHPISSDRSEIIKLDPLGKQIRQWGGKGSGDGQARGAAAHRRGRGDVSTRHVLACAVPYLATRACPAPVLDEPASSSTCAVEHSLAPYRRYMPYNPGPSPLPPVCFVLQFELISDLACDAENNVFVLDASQGRVQVGPQHHHTYLASP